MKKYNKSEIMKNAWSLYRTGRYETFADALGQSWREAKRERTNRENGMVKAEELSVGDTITIEYGDYDNWTTCTITEIAPELFLGKYVSIKAFAGNMEVKFSTEPNKMYKVEQADMNELAA